MNCTPLEPESAFSRAVFKLIRPHIPRERWPADRVRAIFQPAGDGLWLEAQFEGLPASHADVAARLVRQSRVDLVIKSPVASQAAGVVRSKRWRDVSLYACLPLLFSVPFIGAFSEEGMRIALLLCGMDVLALLGLQVALTRIRAAMLATRFVAYIPAPGLKIHLTPRAEASLSDAMPEV